MKNFFLLIICVFGVSNLVAQNFPEHPDESERNKGKAILVHLAFGAH